MTSERWQPRIPPPSGLIRPVRVDPVGASGPTRGQSRGPGWTSVGHGWFVPAETPESVEQRIIEASARLPIGGAVTGWAACRLHGAGFFDGLDRDGRTMLPVPLAIGPSGGTRASAGVRLSRDRLDAGEVGERHGVPCVRAERAVFDAARWAGGVRQAVVVLDMAFAGRISTPARLVAFLDGRSGWQGVRSVGAALDLASVRSRSPAESRLRMIWVLDAGLDAPRVNWAVGDGTGRFLAEVDLLDPVVGLVGEYDGAHHRSGVRHTRDVRREDSLRRVGLEYITVTGRDLVRPALVVDRILAARERALLIPRERRTFLIKVAPGTASDEQR